MIPRFEVRLNPALPAAAAFWAPSADERAELDDDESIGDFHETWHIRTDVDEAKRVMEAERQAIHHADQGSSTVEEYEEILDQAEFECPDMPSDEAPAFVYETDWEGVERLEVGVAGLVYALNAAGAITAASCRGHSEAHRQWAASPVVIFAIDRRRGELLQPLVARAGCGFELDDVNRPELLGVTAGSVVELMGLAQLVIDDVERFNDE